MWSDPDYFTDEQLETAKRLLWLLMMPMVKNPLRFVHTVTYWWASATIGYYTNYVDNLQKVTREDIDRYIKTYISGKPHICRSCPEPCHEGYDRSERNRILLKLNNQ